MWAGGDLAYILDCNYPIQESQMPTFTNVQEIFDNMCSAFKAEKAQNDKAIIQFDLSGDNGGKFWVKVIDGTCATGNGASPDPADITLVTTAEDWLKVTNGELNPMTAFMQGKIKVQGNMGVAMKMQNWFPM
jgi:putative sterol carrier protein